MDGMTRRIHTYPEAMGWGAANFISTVGALMIAASGVLFIVNVVRSYRRGAPAGDNPWGADTLEWATSSPPPSYNFDRIPVLGSEGVVVTGLAEKSREVLITTVVDAMPDHRLAFPNPTIWPFLSAVAVTVMFIGSIFTPWAVVWGSIPIVVGVTLWFWPRKDETREHLALEKRP